MGAFPGWPLLFLSVFRFRAAQGCLRGSKIFWVLQLFGCSLPRPAYSACFLSFFSRITLPSR